MLTSASLKSQVDSLWSRFWLASRSVSEGYKNKLIYAY